MMNEIIKSEPLESIPIFASFSWAELEEIITSANNDCEKYDIKEHIIREGEIGECMYAILDGTVEVSVRSGSGSREITIATLREGDFFSEQLLLLGDTGRRNTSIRASHPSETCIFTYQWHE